jgi:hypothetical protein
LRGKLCEIDLSIGAGNGFGAMGNDNARELEL